MQHHVEIDQSGRTDVLTVDTVLALSDGLAEGDLDSEGGKAAVSRTIESTRDAQGRGWDSFVSAGLVLLLEESVEALESIAIDIEYVGWEGEIKRHLLRKLRQRGYVIEKDQITFRQIGKDSAAHDLAWRIYKRSRIPDQRVGVEELLEAC